MCGVVAIVYRDENDNLGKEASFLLKKLEYRGYDSTGVAFIKKEGTVVLKKKVGAPSKVIRELEIEKHGGFKLIGQVRWATYGSVTDENAQPHQVCCKIHLIGGHNGNISNTDTLKEFLQENGHRVVSDNDGEILVHVIEHFYHEQIQQQKKITKRSKINAMMAAIMKANAKVTGSYAAAVLAPDLEGVFAIKAGSSLYAGKGSDEAGEFILISSDLTSVLSKTRFLIPMVEGDAMFFTHGSYVVFSMRNGEQRVPGLKRSKLNVADISLQQKYHFFMEQEIFTTAANLGAILKYYFPQDWEAPFFRLFEDHKEDCKSIVFDVLKLYEIYDSQQLKDAFERIIDSSRFKTILTEFATINLKDAYPGFEKSFTSAEAQLFHDLLDFGQNYHQALLMLDLIVVWKRKRKVLRYKNRLIELFRQGAASGGRIFLVGAGTSYHAALVASYIFNNLTSVSLLPCNPGIFRSFYLDHVKSGDMIVGVTQSGETKDLVDIFNDIREKNLEGVHLISVINNENSTIPQEKSDFFLPVLCGPEIAVAATKSFIHQIALFYLLAASMAEDEIMVKQSCEKIKAMIEYTLKSVEVDVAEVALNFFLKPSIHILGASLIGLAKEGALKIREVVLNHAEGYDAAEFKHGPNTILGKNTIFSFKDMENLLVDFARFIKEVCREDVWSQTENRAGFDHLLDLVKDFRFSDFAAEILAGSQPNRSATEKSEQLYCQFKNHVSMEKYFSDYPLIFICPPDPRDIRITISQIHTHKIRGADIVLIAEYHEELRKAIEGKPAGVPNYFSKYIRIPHSGDKSIFVFEAAIVLQLLALRMSILKMKYLNQSQIANHGVHPDVPKNVSKSITVD